MKQLQDRVAVVTGASQGIGKAIARAFALEARRWCSLAQAAELDNRGGRDCRRGRRGVPGCHRCEVEADVVNLFSTVTQRHGRLDILVNNAGVTIASPRTRSRCKTGSAWSTPT